MLGHHPFGTARTLLPAGREGGSDDVARSASAHREDDTGREPGRSLPPASPRVLDARQLLVDFLISVPAAITVIWLIYTALPA